MAEEELYKQLLETYTTQIDSVFSDECVRVKDLLISETKHSYEHLIPYPDYENKEFNNIVAHKKEFNRANTDKEQTCGSDTFELSTNQKFLKNFISPFTPYNGLLMFHSVGVGKTCTAISIAERFYQVYKKKILVVLSPNIEDNFKKQIFDIKQYNIKTDQSNQCTGNLYSDILVNKDVMNPQDIEKNINKLIDQKYQFIGYQKLAGVIHTIESDIKKREQDSSKHAKYIADAMRREFSDRLIIIDEAHNLRNPSDKEGKKQISSALMSLLSVTTNIKLVLMTATPMFNDAGEIISLLNLLLANDKRPLLESKQVFDNGNLTEKGRVQLLKMTRGYVSFMRGENPFTFPKRLYPSINDDKRVITKFPKLDLHGDPIPSENMIANLEIVGSLMSKKQEEFYIETINSKVEKDEDEDVEEGILAENESKDRDMQNKVQISNIYFPTNNYGSKAFKECFLVQNKNSSVQISYKGEKEFLSFKEVGNYAPKIKTIIDYIIKSEGIVFIYSQYYASGIYPLIIALEHIGMSKYGSNANACQNIHVDNKFGKKKFSYAILSRDKNLSPNNDEHIKDIKSKANANGDIVKVVIVSKIGTEGIDFKMIREVHILEPWYNMSRIEQIIGRAVRRCSHVDLPEEKRNVTIYLHACIHDSEIWKKRESIDLQMYRISSNKQVRILNVERILKENAVDCSMNLKYLTFPKDIIKLPLMITSQNTEIKNFSLGDDVHEQITCNASVKANSIKVDSSTFHKVFIIDDILLYKKYVANYIFDPEKQTLVFSYDELFNYLKTKNQVVDEEVLNYALDEMVKEKYLILNKGYLIYRRDKYIFQYEKIKDERMSIQERLNASIDKRKTRLKIAMPKKVDVIPKDRKQKVTTEEMDDITQKIEVAYNELKNQMVNILPNISNESLMGYVIDRLEEKDFIACLDTLASHSSNSPGVALSELHSIIIKSLVISKLAILENNKIKYAYNSFKEILWTNNGDRFYQTTADELSQLGDIWKVFKENKEKIDDIEGVMTIDDTGFAFKVMNARKTGRKCISKNLAELEKEIEAIDSTIKLDKKSVKLRCVILELLMREKGVVSRKYKIVKK